MKGSEKRARLLIVSHGDVRHPKMGYLIRVSLGCLQTISSDYIVLQYPNFLKDPAIYEKKDDKRIMTLIAPKNWLLLGIKVIIDALINLRLIRWSDILLIEGSFFVPYAILAKSMHKYMILDSHSFTKFISRDTKGLLNFIKKRIIGEILDYLAVKISDYIVTVSNVDRILR